jgi:hypothetical protein
MAEIPAFSAAIPATLRGSRTSIFSRRKKDDWLE